MGFLYLDDEEGGMQLHIAGKEEYALKFTGDDKLYVEVSDDVVKNKGGYAEIEIDGIWRKVLVTVDAETGNIETHLDDKKGEAFDINDTVLGELLPQLY